ncbi:MAG: hypothetical protein AB7P19_10480 [Nitrospira sp.]
MLAVDTQSDRMKVSGDIIRGGCGWERTVLWRPDIADDEVLPP